MFQSYTYSPTSDEGNIYTDSGLLGFWVLSIVIYSKKRGNVSIAYHCGIFISLLFFTHVSAQPFCYNSCCSAIRDKY
jgi:hypothetical protein